MSMNNFPRVFLNNKEEKEIQQGFPWVFDNEISHVKHRADKADEKSEWKFEKKSQEFTEITGKFYPKRDINMAAAALAKADYKCEVDSKHKTFTSIANKPYTEAFHLVPLNKWYCYNTSLDVPENIVSLCPNCYKKILFGNDDEKYNVLMDLWEKREEVLEKSGIKLSCEEFFKYYGMLVTITV